MKTNIPARVLDCFVSAQTGLEPWPYDDGHGDPYWRFGTAPRDYRWKLTISVVQQNHSSHRTRVPKLYNGRDVKVGDFIASTNDGVAVKIISIEEKTNTELVCVVEDVLRFNTFRDSAGIGNGMFTVPTSAVIFQLNESDLPVVTPLPASGVSSQFYPNLMSRFQDREDGFLLEKSNHGFTDGEMISANPDDNTFVPASANYPYIVGQVYMVPSPDHFVISPIQKIVDNLDYLPGNLCDILYSNNDGDLTVDQINNPVMLKLRDFSNSVLVGSNPNATTTANSIISINGFNHTIGGTTASAFLSAVNAQTSNTGVTASTVLEPNVMRTNSALLSSYGEPLFDLIDSITATATINGVGVSFSTILDGTYKYDGAFATAFDMARDINTAMMNANATIVATTDGSDLVLTETTGSAINITNGFADNQSHYFAGNASASGLALTKSASTGILVKLTAEDARPIDVANILRTPVDDFGLTSVENGQKAAALFIEQGLRQASVTVVANIVGRDALSPNVGDQAHVINKGNTTWGLYLYDGSEWLLIATAESSKTDSDTYTGAVSYDYPEIELGKVTAGSKVTLVSINVTVAFDGVANLSVGTDSYPELLAGFGDVNLSEPGVYLTTPVHVFGGEDTLKIFTTSDGTQGFAIISVSYQ